MIESILIVAVILAGLIGMGLSHNMVKSILCLNICEAGIIMLFLSLAYAPGRVPPVAPALPGAMVDPTPQALMITAIVIGAATTSLALMMSIKLFHHYGTLNWEELIERDKTP